MVMVSDSSRLTDLGEQLRYGLTNNLESYYHNNADELVRACHDGNTFQLLEKRMRMNDVETDSKPAPKNAPKTNM